MVSGCPKAVRQGLFAAVNQVLIFAPIPLLNVLRRLGAAMGARRAIVAVAVLFAAEHWDLRSAKPS